MSEPARALALVAASLAFAHHAHAASPCGPRVTELPGRVAVMPSGDRTGVADRAAITCALGAAPRGGAVELAAGEFFLASGITAWNFDGALRGAGRDVTLLHTVDGYQPADAPWGGPYSHVVLFAYDEAGASGALTVADFTLIVDGPTLPWGDQGFTAVAGFDAMYFGDRVAWQAALDLDVTYEGLGALGEATPGEEWGARLWFVFTSELPTSGRVVVRDIVAEGVASAALVQGATDAEVVVGGPDPSDRIVVTDTFFGAIVESVQGCEVSISNVHATRAVAGVSFQAYGGKGTNVVIRDNVARDVQVGAEYIHGHWVPGDPRPPNTGLITRNTIQGGGGGDGIAVIDESSLAPTTGCDTWTESWPRALQPAGVQGEALGFWGWTGGMVVPDRPRLDLTDGFTLAGWIQLDEINGTWSKLVSKSLVECGPPWHAWSLGVTGWGAPHLEVTIGGQGYALLADDALVPGRWAHLAATWDGTRLKLYVDGKLAKATRATGPLERTDTPLTVGASWNCGDGLMGRVDEVRVYPRALSAGAVAGLMKGPGLRGGEVAYYSADAATISGGLLQRIADGSGNGLDGYINPTCLDEPVALVTVTHNTIDWSSPFGGIWIWGAQDAVIEDNTIRGEVFSGIYLSQDGEPVRNCRIAGNNLQGIDVTPSSEQTGLPATPIFLGAGTRGCEVVARPADVVDWGTDNRITARRQ